MLRSPSIIPVLPHVLVSAGGWARQLRELKAHYMSFLLSLTTLVNFYTNDVSVCFSLKMEFRNGIGMWL